MSSGACRALVAVVLTLAASMVMALPVVAEKDQLLETSTAIYQVHPSTGKIDVEIIIPLTNNSNKNYTVGTWGPVIAEERVKPNVNTRDGFKVGSSTDLSGLWKGVEVETPRIDGGGGKETLFVKYTVDASIDQPANRAVVTPARVGRAYVYLCVPGQDTDVGQVRVEIDGNRAFKLTQSGTVLEPTSKGLKSGMGPTPGEVFTCIEGTRDGRLAKTSFIGPSDRQINLQAWPEKANWLDAAEDSAKPALDAIHAFIGHDMPGDGPVIIRQAPPRSLGGYASAHDSPGIVQLDESAGVIDPNHELAHAWFGTDNFIELWLREGMAVWTATSMEGQTCAPAAGGESGLDLADWEVVRPTADPETIEQTIAAQEAAACGIVSAVAGRMGEEQWGVVLGALLDGETKYVGSAGPSTASTARVDFREWLDAVDERGLVPAAKADPTYAANLTELDFAQDLLADYSVPTDPLELIERSEARARYHQFLADAAPLGAPLAVREAMDNWLFDDAMRNLDQAYEVLDALNEANALLPNAGLIPFVQPAFESARNPQALQDVLQQTRVLLESANEVTGPLGELQAAAPDGWSLPAAINDAIIEQRFEDILTAIPPARRVVQEVSAANEALPTAGLLDKYRARYESTATASRLEELADLAAEDRSDAERTNVALEQLLNEVGEWRIPDAVTAPIESGQIDAARAIVEDARAVVSAARAADEALPEAELGSDLRPRFEAVLTSADMAALRAEAEVKRGQALSVGSALSSLSSRVPGWRIPEVVTTPIAERDFATAAQTATTAQKWIENAWQADQELPQMGAITRTQPLFEGAQSLEDLETGAALAENWNTAASRVASAVAAAEAPRDLLADLGLWGTDVRPTVDAAIEAAVAGDVAEALSRAAEVIDVMNSGSSSGGLRLAGLVFLGLAVMGVMGLWVMLRRQRGPSWARQTRPHWVDKEDGPRWRLGSGKKDD